MAKRKFEIDLSGIVTLELDEEVINTVDDDFRANIYNLRNLKDIIEHLAYNLVVNQFSLSDLDGWADQPNSNARILDEDWDIDFKEIK